eukprot:3640113-Rhodomonas_salina.2
MSVPVRTQEAPRQTGHLTWKKRGWRIRVRAHTTMTSSPANDMPCVSATHRTANALAVVPLRASFTRSGLSSTNCSAWRFLASSGSAGCTAPLPW